MNDINSVQIGYDFVPGWVVIAVFLAVAVITVGALFLSGRKKRSTLSE